MLSSLFFVGVTLLLILEGMFLCGWFFGEKNFKRDLAFSLPLSAFTNVLIVFVFTCVSVPLNPWTLVGTHLIIMLVAFYFTRMIFEVQTEVPHPRTPLLIGIPCTVIIVSTVIYAFSHAVLLPTFQYDSATNWTMRSEISFYDEAIAFDKDENRGMAKPQYPFFFHALQVTANQGQTEWNDTAANSILLLLSVATFAAVGLIVSMLRGKTHALMTVTAFLTIPLLSLHLAQGYGDINLAQQFLLSAACMAAWIHSKNEKWLLLSAIFVAASVWTKSEGAFFGLIPWILLSGYLYLQNKTDKKPLMKSGGLALILSLPWLGFALFKGLLLTPHGTDSFISFYPEGVSEAFFGLFFRGSFGILWYVLFLLVPFILTGVLKKSESIGRKYAPVLYWGIFVFLGFLFVYLCTPNVQFLLNAESFYRQMMVAGALLVLGCSLCLKFKVTRNNP